MISLDYQSYDSSTTNYYITFNDERRTNYTVHLPIDSEKWINSLQTFQVPVGATKGEIYLYAPSLDDKTNIVVRFDNIQIYNVPNIKESIYAVSENSNKLINPSIQFEKVAATRSQIKVSGAITPFFLTLSESFHPRWKVYFKEVQKTKRVNLFKFNYLAEIPDNEHFIAGNFSNGWYIDTYKYCEVQNLCTLNPDGSYNMELVVEFTPQRWFNLGLLISSTTLLLCLSYLVFYTFKQRRRGNPIINF
jgi:hypothetical protein